RPSVKASMAKAAKMRQEYDFSCGIRGNYIPRLAKGANVVLLEGTASCRVSITYLLFFASTWFRIPPSPPLRNKKGILCGSLFYLVEQGVWTNQPNAHG